VTARRIWACFVIAAAITSLMGCSSPGASRAPATASPSQLALNAVFNSPTGLYTIRYNRNWPVQQVQSQAGPADYFKLPGATFAVTTDHILPGTQLEAFVQSTIVEYRSVNYQGIERAGAINVGGGHGELLHLVTYVDTQGATVARPPSPDAKPRNLYQAFYLAGDQSYTFSIAWPRDDTTDYLSLFRNLLQTFTLAGAS
jgi:hypothetical protein